MTDRDYYRNILNILGLGFGAGKARVDNARRGKSAAGEDIEPCYVISVAARILGLQTHTLRYYEKKGIIEPSRSQGNIRLYSRKDIDRLRLMKALTDLGVNAAGAEVILGMRQYIMELKRRVEGLEVELEEMRGGKRP